MRHALDIMSRVAIGGLPVLPARPPGRANTAPATPFSLAPRERGQRQTCGTFKAPCGVSVAFICSAQRFGITGSVPSCGVMQRAYLPKTGGVRPGAMPVSGAAVFLVRV